MGAGKTSVGRALASRCGRDFIDLDATIEAATSTSVARLFALRGEAAFRALEREQIEALLATPGDQVVALGGGSLLDPALRLAVLRSGLLVTLTSRASELARRIADPRSRPLLVEAGSPPEAVLARLLRERGAAYSAAHITIDTTDRSVEVVAAALAARLDAGAVPLTISSEIAYALLRADGAAADATADVIESLVASRVALVTDDNVARLHLDAFVAQLSARGIAVAASIVLPSGEEEKHFAAVERVLTELVAAECDRHSVVIGLGGGVVTDITGFAASIFMRGVRWLAVPTTLLGMVDAAIGGKTGVNLPLAKNAVGSFHHPAAVVIDTSFSTTETQRAVMSGLAEVVKVAAVRDRGFFEKLERDALELRARDRAALASAVDGAARIKAAVVSDDPGERGARAVLNFGHTLGHALEAATSYGTFAHGEAVAIGMVAASEVGKGLGCSAAGVAERLRALLERLGLPLEVPESLGEAALSLIRHDKKRMGDNVTLVLVDVLGSAVLLPVSVELCTAAFRRTIIPI